MANGTEPKASPPNTGPARPKRRVGEVAAELTRLYASLGLTAVDLTPAYLQQRFAGPKGETWDRDGLDRRDYPILGPVIRQAGNLLLGAGYNLWGELVKEFELSDGSMLVPIGERDYVNVDTVAITRSGAGSDPGEAYVVANGDVLRAGYKYSPPSLTYVSGRPTQSAGRFWIGDTFSPMIGVDNNLSRVVASLQAYEAIAAQPVA